MLGKLFVHRLKNEVPNCAEQFQVLNAHITSAISEKDYVRATTLDRHARIC